MRISMLIAGLSLAVAGPLAAQSMDGGGMAAGTGGMSTMSMAKPPSFRNQLVKYYPQAKLDAEGKVSLKFIVGTDGHPEANSFEILKVSDSAFVEAARMMVMAQEYRPANDHGKDVRAYATTEVRFKPGKMACDVTIKGTSGMICVDSLKSSH